MFFSWLQWLVAFDFLIWRLVINIELFDFNVHIELLHQPLLLSSFLFTTDHSNYIIYWLWLSIWRKSLDISSCCLLYQSVVFWLGEHLYMVLEHFFRKAFMDPRMLQCLKWCHAFHGTPFQTALEEINEQFFCAIEDTFKRFWVDNSNFASWVRSNDRLVVRVKEEMLSSWILQHRLIGHSTYLHYVCQLICLVFTRKKWITSIELS